MDARKTLKEFKRELAKMPGVVAWEVCLEDEPIIRVEVLPDFVDKLPSKVDG